jgi:CBS domain-containing protein
MVAKDIMSTPIISVAPDTSVSEVAALLADQHISGVPVLEQGRLVGVVNEIDLLHRHELGTEQLPPVDPWWVRLFRADRALSHYVKSHAVKASDVMTRAVVSVSEDASLPEIASLFDSRAVRRVCVAREGRVVGIITRADLVRAMAANARPPRDERPLTDDAIRKDLLAELAKQRWWRPEWSAVTVEEGVVRFHGAIDTAEERVAARVAAENIPGVRKVEDHRERFADLPRSL